ncbi:MAG: DUF5723 family protein [bacterium]|nr:DUF5723 family protein [bacterium]
MRLSIQFLRSVLLLVTLTFQVHAEITPTAVTAGTANAGISTVRGGDARWVNPALLGISGGPKQSILLPSFGYRLGNSAMKSSEMSKWFREDRYWTEDERKSFSSSVKNDFTLNGAFQGGIGYQVNAMSAAIDVIGVLDGSIPGDVIRLAVLGNESGKNYSLSKLKGGSWVGTSFGVSFAKQLHRIDWAKEFAIGMTAKYIVGMAYSGLRDTDGSILTSVDPDTVSAHGYITTATTNNGDGIGIDIGAAARMNDRWGWSFSLMNISGRVSWDKVKVRANKFDIEDSGIPIDSLTQEGFLERWANYSSTTLTESGSVDVALPQTMLIGLDYKVNDYWLTYGSFEQGLNESATSIGSTTKTRLALGSEYTKFDKYPLRAGFAVGGMSGFELAIGGGLRLSNYRLDVSMNYERGLFYGAKGYGFSLSQQITLR